MKHDKLRYCFFVLVATLMLAAPAGLRGDTIMNTNNGSVEELAGSGRDPGFDRSDEKHHYPQNADLLEKIGMPDAQEEFEEWWKKEFVEETIEYPMEFKLLYPRICVLRLADDPAVILPDDTWFIETWQEKSALDTRKRRYGAVTVLPKMLMQQNQKHKVFLYLDLLPSDRHALSMTVWNAFRSLKFSTRPSTFSGIGPMIQVQNASFFGNYAGEGAQMLSWSIGNLGGMLRVREEERPDIVTNATLGEMASRLSLLFDDPPKDVQSADIEGMTLDVRDEERQRRIVVETPKDGPYADWWLRLDTAEGKIEVQAPGEAVLKGIPEDGVTVTVYAISPDGKTWHSVIREIR